MKKNTNVSDAEKIRLAWKEDAKKKHSQDKERQRTAKEKKQNNKQKKKLSSSKAAKEGGNILARAVRDAEIVHNRKGR